MINPPLFTIFYSHWCHIISKQSVENHHHKGNQSWQAPDTSPAQPGLTATSSSPLHCYLRVLATDDTPRPIIIPHDSSRSQTHQLQVGERILFSTWHNIWIGDLDSADTATVESHGAGQGREETQPASQATLGLVWLKCPARNSDGRPAIQPAQSKSQQFVRYILWYPFVFVKVVHWNYS